jgi:hypothetical protein
MNERNGVKFYLFKRGKFLIKKTVQAMKMHIHATHPFFRVLFLFLMHSFYTDYMAEKHVKYRDAKSRLIFNALGTAGSEAVPLIAIMHLCDENSLQNVT